MTRRLCIAAVALLGCGGLSASAQESLYHFKDDAIAWSACPDPAIAGLECAVYEVPRDYRQADGPTVELALRRMRAQGDAAEGVLFFNPGGPGGTGSGQFPQWYGLFPAAIRQAFDIVSWDPRGMGESSKGQCFADGDAEGAVIGAFGAFPTTFDEQRAWIDAYTTFAEACAANAADILAHVSTADAARDLEQLRIAAGSDPLNYWGVSYGTFLGATYANLFPDNVRTLVLDGNLSPLAWTAEGDPAPQTTIGDRIGSYQVAEVFQHFLQLCTAAGPDRCAFAAASYELTRRKWDELLDRLAEGPVYLTTDAGVRTLTLGALVGQIDDGMDIVWPIPGSNGWPAIANALEELHSSGMAKPAAAPAPATAATPAASPAPSAPAAYDGAEGVIAVMCGDTPAVGLERFPTLASEAMLRSGYFGLATSYVAFPCATWTIAAADPFLGPWDAPLSAAPLVVNTTHDPSTPMQNAEAMAGLLPGAALLRVNGYGHTSLLNRSTCADNLIAAYVLERTLPAPDTWCAQDRQPFEDARQD